MFNLTGMFQKLEPRNDEWNRKYKFTDENSTGFFLEFKNGLAFFGWKFGEDPVKFYECEKSVFEKRFKISNDLFEYELISDENKHFLRYPIDL